MLEKSCISTKYFPFMQRHLTWKVKFDPCTEIYFIIRDSTIYSNAYSVNYFREKGPNSKYILYTLD